MTYNADDDTDSRIRSILRKYCRRYKIVNIKNVGEHHMEAFYQVIYKRKFKSASLISELKEMENVDTVNLFFDQDDADPVF